MNLGLWMQYGVITVLLLLCIGYTVRKLRASARSGGCAGGCGACGGCGPRKTGR